MHIIYSTFSSQKDACKMAYALVKNRLAACASFHKISSIYFWKGKICNENEWLLEAKTANAKQAMAFIRKNHPYSLPMVYALKASLVEKKYGKWVTGNLLMKG